MRFPYYLATLVFTVACCASTAVFANGYNRINEIAVPALIIAFAVCYPVVAVVLAIIVYWIFRLVSKKRGSFGLTFSGALLFGEVGIGICVLIDKYVTAPGEWNSFDYALYPELVGVLTVAGAIVGYLIRSR